MADPKILALIMAGGSGTRFWPASRPENPKQYLNLLGASSLIQKTVARLIPEIPANSIAVCSTTSQTARLRDQLPEVKTLISEPEGKNTAACVALSALSFLKQGHDPKTVLITLPADHFIHEEQKFRDLLKQAARFAVETGNLITFGIIPEYAHTGYGYIERGPSVPGSSDVFLVSRFVEKPDKATAEAYLKSQSFYWNSGMFVWTLAAIETAFKKYMPSLWNRLEEGLAKDTLPQIYRSLPSIPIDVGILEKADNVAVITANIGWSDVGSWNAVYSLQKPDEKGNVSLQAQTALIESKNCLVYGPSTTEVALVGVQDLIVVVDQNRVLVCHRDSDQLVRETGKRFK